MAYSGKVGDDKHRLVLHYYDHETEDFDLEIIHPQSCTVWFGCEHREPTFSLHLAPCPPYHHAHPRLDCALAYYTDEIGITDALGIMHMTDEHAKATWELLRINEGVEIPISYTYSWGVTGYYEPEYDDELSWDFLPYFTHLWDRSRYVCTWCGSTKQEVVQSHKRCSQTWP